MIHFNCKGCQQLFSVRDDFAGREGACPQCRTPFKVPPTSEPGAGPQAAPPPRAAPPPPQPVPPPATIGTTQSFNRPAVVPPGVGAPLVAPSGGGVKLEVVHGPAAIQGKTFNLPPGRIVIGRDPAADLSIPSERVSRRHCALEPTGDGSYVLKDLGSSNGTLVNQVPIPGPKVLMGGEYIQTGDCLFRFSG